MSIDMTPMTHNHQPPNCEWCKVKEKENSELMPKYRVRSRFTRVYEYEAVVEAESVGQARTKGLQLDSNSKGLVERADYDGNLEILFCIEEKP